MIPTTFIKTMKMRRWRKTMAVGAITAILVKSKTFKTMTTLAGKLGEADVALSSRSS
jgi:hypothetical protein